MIDGVFIVKGVVFTEFIEFVEDEFSVQMADEMIDASELASGGAYTSVGTYDHLEMLQLVAALSEKTEIPVADLVRTFGRHLFRVLVSVFPQFLQGAETSFDFLRSVENYIHIEVKKLYADAELPHFEYSYPTQGVLELIYRSKRPLGDLAHGLIEGCVEHFKESLALQREDLADDNGTTIRFTLSCTA